jgi:hypothetical protein
MHYHSAKLASSQRMWAATLSVLSLAAVPSALAVAGAADPIWCTVAAERQEVTFGEPVWLRLECENRSATSTALELSTGSGAGWQIVPSDGTIGCFPKDGAENVPPGRVPLPAGGRVTMRVLLNRWSGMLKPGSYRARLVSCSGAFSRDSKGGRELSREVVFDVAPLDLLRLAEACKGLARTVVASGAPIDDRLQAAEALSWIDLPLAVPYLQDVMLKGSGQAVLLAVRGLGRIGSPEAVRALVEAYGRDPILGMAIAATLQTTHASRLDAETQRRVDFILQHPFRMENQ